MKGPTFTLQGFPEPSQPGNELPAFDTQCGKRFHAGQESTRGPSVSWSLFDSGRVRSQIELENALRDESVLAYRQTVLTALLEVEDAMIAAAKEQERHRALVEAVAANRKAVDLSTTLYSAGEADFLNVLAAQRSLYSAEDALVQSTGTTSTQLIALYKALGGGWEAR